MFHLVFEKWMEEDITGDWNTGKYVNEHPQKWVRLI